MSRRDLSRNDGFDNVSPELGELKPDAFDDLMEDDPESALDLLAQMVQATDVNLARLARNLAGRLVLDLTRIGTAKSRGVGKLARVSGQLDGDIDIEASLEAIVAAKAERRPVAVEDVVSTAWRKPGIAICLLIDRSGSMNGERLASAALAAAICSWRAPAEFAVLAFDNRVVSIKELRETAAPERVVTDVLGLRGHGTTDIGLALAAAGRQLAQSAAPRRITLLLSDAESTTGSDPVPLARALTELAVLAPSDEPDHARQLAAQVGARLEEVDGPFAVLPALQNLVE